MVCVLHNKAALERCSRSRLATCGFDHCVHSGESINDREWNMRVLRDCAFAFLVVSVLQTAQLGAVTHPGQALAEAYNCAFYPDTPDVHDWQALGCDDPGQDYCYSIEVELCSDGYQACVEVCGAHIWVQDYQCAGCDVSCECQIPG